MQKGSFQVSVVPQTQLSLPWGRGGGDTTETSCCVNQVVSLHGLPVASCTALSPQEEHLMAGFWSFACMNHQSTLLLKLS